jgi:hypothetical protein
MNLTIDDREHQGVAAATNQTRAGGNQNLFPRDLPEKFNEFHEI